MGPTVFRADGFRFYFFSREERRMHVHVHTADGEAKFWLEPAIEPADVYGLNKRKLNAALSLIREHQDEICQAWEVHFEG